MGNREGIGMQKLRETVNGIRSTNPKPKKKSIEEMTYTELLEAEEKFLTWYETTDHPEKQMKKHIYDTYIVPRIAELRFERDVEDAFVGTEPEPPSQTTGTQVTLIE